MTFRVGNIVEITRCASDAPERARGFVGLRARVHEGGDDPFRTRLQLIGQERRPDGFRGDSWFNWPTEYLRLVESAPREETSQMPIPTTDAAVRVGGFAVGDRVRVARPFSCVPIGTTGTVSRVDPDGDGYSRYCATIGVRFDTSPSSAASSAGHYGPGHFIAKDRPEGEDGAPIGALELVEAAPTPGPTPQRAPEFTQKTGEIEVGDKVTLKSTDDFPGNSSVPSSFAGVVLTVIDKRGRIIDLQLPSGLHRCGWLADRFEHARVPVDATAAPEPEPTPEAAPATPTTRFVVGDRVRLTARIGGDAEVGDLGTVEAVLGGAYDVRFDGRVLGARGKGVHYAAEATLEAAPAATPEPTPEPTSAPDRPLRAGDKVVLKSVEEFPDNRDGFRPEMLTFDTVYTISASYTEGDTYADVDEDDVGGIYIDRFKLAPQTAEPPTFQVGDRVRIKVAEHADRAINQIGVIRRLLDTSGQFYDQPHPYAVRLDNGDVWEVAVVELADAAPTPEPTPAHPSGFAIGDRVRLVRSFAGLPAGATGTVTRLDDDELDAPNFAVKFDALTDGGFYGGGEYVVDGASYFGRFERVEAATPPTPEPTPPPPSVPGPSAAHLRDIELIGTYMAEQARQGEADGGWCSAYDRLIEGLNPQLTVALRGRIRGA